MSIDPKVLAPESPLTRPDSLDQYEMGGVISIFIKTYKADRRIEVLNKIIESSQAELAELRLNRAKVTSALSIYGFDPSAPKIWTAVRAVIGDDEYFRAIEIARGQAAPPASRSVGGSAKADVPISDQSEGVGVDSEDAEPAHPKISDAILAFLKASGASGAKVAAVKEHLAKAYGIETHEKTPGMTLYRLLKGGKVARDGRNWFYVDPTKSGATENPGGETPGNDDSATKKETAEC